MAPRHMVELHACGPDDPDGSRTATILSAYFHAEHMRAFRRLLWRRLAIVAVMFLAGGEVVSLSRPSLLAGVAMIAAAGGWGAVLEWHASEKLTVLLDAHGPAEAGRHV